MKEYGTARQATEQNTIWWYRCASWITKATDTNANYLRITAFFTAKFVVKKH